MEDLSKYWFLQNRKEKGAPVGISECSIRTEFNERNPHALRPSDYDEWTSSGWKKVELPEELWLISPDRKYLFDIRWFHYGFVVSERFLELLLSDSTQPFVHREVFIRNRKRIITEGRYYYLRFYSDTSNLIDKDRSQLSYNKKHGYISAIKHLSIVEDVPWNVFMISDAVLLDKLFISESFRQKCLDLKLIGSDILPAQEAGLSQFF